jgi:pimeloyl-ACP methyl ester carboxylesterase
MSPALTDRYDVVFFDQRGIGASEPFRCDDAFLFAVETVVPSSTPVERNSFARATERFVEECFAEAGVDPADADRYSTRQAAEDLEAFRDWLGADELALYGESYGTQFAQTYAAAHPDRVAALVLDGVVDLRTDAFGFAVQQAQAFSDVLAAVLVDCDADPLCAPDAPGSALEEYDRLAAELAEGALPYRYPLPGDLTDERELTLEDLHAAALSSLSEPYGRAALQQALNAAARDNLVPLARLAASGDASDPATGEFVPDPTFSEGLYFAVQCADYDVVPPNGSGREQVDVWLDAAAAAGVPDLRLADPAYGDLPCLFWPDGGARPTRPDPGIDPPYPMLLLGADTDPNTPPRNAEQVFERTVDDTALLLLQGGPHVIYGRGDECVDDVVEDVVRSGRLPAWRSTSCPGEIADPYLPLPPLTARGYTDGPQTVDAVLGALLGDPLYGSWYGPEHLVLGCEAGGSARYLISQENTVHVWLAGCAWTPGVPVDGHVSITDGGSGDISARLTLPFADLSVAPDGSISGEFRGRPVR